MLELENKEHMQQLNLLFNANSYLSADFILGALAEKIESNIEEDEVDDHMKESAHEANGLLNQMYGSWLGW